MNLRDRLSNVAAKLPDEQLVCELECAEKCALLATRTRKEAALLRARCLRLELERRAVTEAHTIISRARAASA